MNKTKGIAAAMTAAFIYGFTPILAKYTYLDGSNTVSLTFYRSFMSIPILYILLKHRKADLTVTKSELGKLSVLGLLGACLTGLMLYGAYNYISVGMTTTIHYIYPVLVTSTCVIFYREPISRVKITALILSMAGILLFFEGDLSLNLTGIALALGSGTAYAAYLIFIDKSGIKGMNPFKISFYCCIVASVFLFIFGMASRQLVFSMSPVSWLCTFLVSFFVSVLANSFMPVAVKYVGSTVTAILGMFEPITSVILGILLLSEPCTLRSVLGCALIITAVTILTLSKDQE